jgi:hypothetical protein
LDVFPGGAMAYDSGMQHDGNDISPGVGEDERVRAEKRARLEAQARKAAERDLRLKAQLRANLQRRKVQVRARREGSEDDRPGDLAGSTSRD